MTVLASTRRRLLHAACAGTALGALALLPAAAQFARTWSGDGASPAVTVGATNDAA